MQWSDDGLVIGARRHGESGVILELMTRAHGRHLGLVHGGRTKRLAPVLQPGNTVRATWRARIDDALGNYTVEPVEEASSRLIASRLALYGLAHLAGLLRLLPERDPHPALHEAAMVMVEHLDDPGVAPALMVRFELAILAELGFGLDLTECAATGATADLTYVSPKSGRAVSQGAGTFYKDKLLALPGFLVGGAEAGQDADHRGAVRDGFRLTGYFLQRHIWDVRGHSAPEERERFVALAAQIV
jgi:DNA repair protein RecO (recombination protein O)